MEKKEKLLDPLYQKDMYKIKTRQPKARAVEFKLAWTPRTWRKSKKRCCFCNRVLENNVRIIKARFKCRDYHGFPLFDGPLMKNLIICPLCAVKIYDLTWSRKEDFRVHALMMQI